MVVFSTICVNYELLRKWVMELPMGSVKKLKSMLDDTLKLQYMKP
jgi:uncharacterized membrane protein (UPF0127 family)